MKRYELLNTYLSNLAVLNVKLHSLHWNVVGINFMAIHTFTEELYTEFFEKYDAVAEHLKMQGQVPLSTTKAYLEHTTIVEIEPEGFSIKDVINYLITDLEQMKQLALDIHKVADEDHDFTAVAMFEDTVAELDKHLWFLNAMSQ